MAVEIFSKTEFENALPKSKTTGQPLWTHKGLVQGEHAYAIDVQNPRVQIIVRSSVHANGLSANTGEDSIRAWLIDPSGRPLGAKIQKYVTRVAGWQGRMIDMLRKLAKLAKKIRQCPRCTNSLGIVKIKKGTNAGKLALTCSAKNPDGNFCNHYFEILNDD